MFSDHGRREGRGGKMKTQPERQRLYPF